MTNNKKVIKIQCPFERIKKYNPNPEAGLYKAVIMQMIIDASNISDDPKTCRNEKRAKEWLFAGGDDFETVCAMAGIGTNVVQIFARSLIAIHHEKGHKVINKNKTPKRKTLGLGRSSDNTKSLGLLSSPRRRGSS